MLICSDFFAFSLSAEDGRTSDLTVVGLLVVGGEGGIAAAGISSGLPAYGSQA